MEDQGQLGYEDELLCLITGRGGHMSDVPIEAFLGEAGILAGDTVTMTANRDSGVVTIAAPAVAAKMQNDAVILELARRLTLCDKSLVGQYIMAEVENDRYDGEIIEVGYNWWRAQETSCEVKRQSLCLLHPDLILAIGQNENEARGIFDARKAALQPFNDDNPATPRMTQTNT